MASNKHHKLTKQVMARVSDLLTNYLTQECCKHSETALPFIIT